MIIYDGYRQSRLGQVAYYTPWPAGARGPVQEAFVLEEGPVPTFESDEEMRELPEQALAGSFPAAELVVAGIVAVLAATLA